MRQLKVLISENENALGVLLCSQCDQEIFIYFMKQSAEIFLCLRCCYDALKNKKQVDIQAKYSIGVLDCILKVLLLL
jgi:hypothetical protein